MASIATFVGEVAALSITGVTRAYTYPPKQLGTADLPASFVMPPSSEYEIIAVCDDVNDTFSVRLFIAIEPANQNTQTQNFTTLLTIMDNTNAALKAATFTDMLPAQWTLSPQTEEPVFIDSTAYWGVVATVTAQGAN